MPAFCIKLPASYAVKDARTAPTKGSIAYDTGSHTDNLMISYDTTSIKCSFAYKPKNPPPKDATDACRSIVIPAGG